MSLQECGRRFAQETESAGEIHRVIIFGHAYNYRDHNQLLYALTSTFHQHHITFQEAIFTLPSKSSPTNGDSQLDPASVTTGRLQGYTGTWERLYPDSTTHTIVNIQSAGKIDQ